MARPVKRMPTPLGVGAGQTAHCQLPLGLTYERLYIRANVDAAPKRDVPKADWGTYFDEIRLMVNGDARITITAADLVKLNEYYEQPMVDGCLPLFLSRPWMRTPDGEDQTAYGTAGGLTSFSLEIDIKDGVVINDLDVYAMQSPGRPFGPHLRIQRYVHNQGVVGEAEIADIIRGRYALGALHITTAAIEDIELHVDNRKVIELDKVVRAQHHAVAGRTEQGGMTHLDLMAENRLSQAMPMAVSDFRLKADFTATGNFSIYAESVQPGTAA
jgi:hypothetical protein